MKILITGIYGFVGSTIARELLAHADSGSLQIVGVDNLSRSGSSLNRNALHKLGIHICHGDIRLASDLELVGQADWVIDAVANPAVLAGVDGRVSSRQRRPLTYVGFDGEGHQVRGRLHPRDIIPLLQKQMNASKREKDLSQR